MPKFNCIKQHLVRLFEHLKGTKSENKDLRSEYYNFKSDTEIKILTGFNIVIILINAIIFVEGLIKFGVQAIHLAVLIFSILTLFVRKLSIRIWRLLVVLCSITIITFVLNNPPPPLDSPRQDFIFGNILGIAEFIIVLSLKNLFLKILVLGSHVIIEIVTLSGGLKLEIWIFYCLAMVFCLGFYIYYDFLERKNFQTFYGELRKFQSLLSKDLPTSLVVTDLDFQTILYYNDFFKKKIQFDDSSVESLFQKFKIKNSLGDEDIFSPQKNALSNLYDYVKRFSSHASVRKEKEGNIILANMESSDKGYSYEIRLQEITWDSTKAYAVVFNDISDKQIVLGLKYVNEQQNRVINTLSHELKTPINCILGIVRILRTQLEESVRQTYLDYCESCSNLQLHLINSILDYNQIKNQGRLEIRKKSFNLEDFLKEVKGLFHFHAENKNIDFSVDLDPNTPKMIYTDRNRLIMILTILIGNAFKFTSKGSIKLRVCLDEANLHRLLFQVTDTGHGIKEEDKSKILKLFGHIPYSKENGNSKGIGLGLTTTNELVKILNDSEDGLKFESVFQEGSTFYFKLDIMNEPLFNIILPETGEEEEESLNTNMKDLDIREITSADELISKRIETHKSNKDEVHVTMIQHHHHEISELSSNDIKLVDYTKDQKPLLKNILVVDDNPFNILAVSFILEKLKFKITKAFHGQECLDVLEESLSKPERFDLILMDIQMPVLDGVEASRMIKERIQQGVMYPVPIIALTANKVDQKERDHYKRNGILECLEKPLKEGELVEVLQRLGLR